MADEINIISDEDLRAPLALANNYDVLASKFDDVVVSASKANAAIEDGARSVGQQRDVANQLVDSQKKLDKANEKAAKSTKDYGAAMDFANEQTGGMVNQVKSLGKQFVALLANPVGPFLLLIAGALASVTAYFRSTGDGADKLDKIMAAVGATVSFLTNKIIALGEKLVNTFEESETLGKVLTFVFDQIVNRISGIIDAASALVDIIGAIAEGDWEKAKQGVINYGKAWIQTVTGIGNAADEAKEKIKSLVALTEAQDQLGDDIRDRILSKAQAQLEIEKQLFIAKDKANQTDEARLAALRKAVQISEEQSKIDIDLAVRKERAFAAELLHKKGIITTEAEANKILAQGTTQLQDQLLSHKAIDEELEERKRLQADVINLQREFFAENKKNVAQIGALETEIGNEAREGRIQAFDERLRMSKEVFTAEAIGAKSNLEIQEGLNKRFNQRLVDDAKARADKEKEIEKAKTERLKEEIKKRQELEATLFAAAALAQTVVLQFIDQRRAKLDEQSVAAEDQRKKELAAAEGDERKKLAINRKFDREQAKIKQKQAQADKQAALFNILISTAMGIARVAPNPVLIALVAAIGAVQAAFVASKPLPKFWMGTKYSPDSFVAGDRGRELVVRGNQGILADKPTIFTGMEGSTVFNKRETDNILGDMSDVGYALSYGSKVKNSVLSSSIISDRLNESNKLLRRIANKPEASLVIDEEGFRMYSSKLAAKTERINRRFKGR